MKAKIHKASMPPTKGGNDFYVSNRHPLLPSPLIKLPAGSINPRGWLRGQLRLMADGMIGHISEVSPWIQPGSGWLNPEHGGDERVPYWLKGYISMGYALEDKEIIDEAHKWIEGVMAGQAKDGYFGPQVNRNRHLWPNMLMLFALRTYYEATSDQLILDCMTRYFRYQLNIPEDQLFTGVKWQRLRAGDNLESIYWLYNHTGEQWLLELAQRIHRRAADWTNGVTDDPRWKEEMPIDYPVPSDHGVNITMGYREPAVYYQQARDEKYLDATERIYSLIMGDFGQIPGGMFGADERIRSGKTDPHQAAETCSVVEFMYSHESLLRVTGDPSYAGRCENIAFNTLPCTMTPDCKAIHYLTAPNQPQCDAGDKPCFRNNEKMLSYSPGTEYHCCQHNHSQGWPYFAEHLWLATQGNGLAAIFYAPCSVEATVGDGVKVNIAEGTDYPFGETVDFAIRTPEPVQFPWVLRIPYWCQEARVTVNGQLQDITPTPASYLVIERIWNDGDRVRLDLPMQITLTVWEKNKNAVSVNRGPLTYSLKIGERWVKSGDSEQWPEWEVLPTTPWNYGLIVDRQDPSASFEVIEKGAVPDQPFTLENAPVELRAYARRIPNWTMVDDGLCVGELQPSPVKSDEPIEQITLIPMGCARLRISAFPTIGEGPNAHQWQPASSDQLRTIAP